MQSVAELKIICNFQRATRLNQPFLCELGNLWYIPRLSNLLPLQKYV